jgi:hypothetical protein
MGVSVLVGGAAVGAVVSVGWTADGTTSVVTAGAGASVASAGALEGREQAESKNTRIREEVRNFFMFIYLGWWAIGD